MAINYDSLIKRANRVIDKAAAKLHSAKIHLVNQDSDIKQLSGLVIVLHPDTTTTDTKAPPVKTSAH